MSKNENSENVIRPPFGIDLARQEQNELVAHLICDYDEFNPMSYRGVVLEITDNETFGDKLRFKSFHPARDKNAAMEAARLRGAKVRVMSSWDNFVSDSLQYIAKEGKKLGNS